MIYFKNFKFSNQILESRIICVCVRERERDMKFHYCVWRTAGGGSRFH